MQLEELPLLCRDKIGSISAGCFLGLGEEQYEDSVIALGTDNGSVVFIDSRTASILIVCIGLVSNTPIIGISFSKSQEEEAAKLILFTNTTNIICFSLFQGINSILASMEENQSQSRSTNR